MTLEEASTALTEKLRKSDINFMMVGICERNDLAYNANPHMFAKCIDYDSLVVYTKKKPTASELKMTSFEGFPVRWAKIGSKIKLN